MRARSSAARSSCTDPTGLRGISVGGADEYDYRDPGQAVPIDGVADGTYWFRALSDPNNDFVEADESDNETDVQVTIAAGRVTAGAVRHPDSTPPAVAITSPSDGTLVKGSVDVTATTAAASERSSCSSTAYPWRGHSPAPARRASRGTARP